VVTLTFLFLVIIPVAPSLVTFMSLPIISLAAADWGVARNEVRA
jgi:hypothetical protein